MRKLVISYGWSSRTWLKSVSVFLMSLLLFLTVMNYFVYSEDHSDTAIENAASEDGTSGLRGGSPAGPDEKSPDAPVTVNEEFIHKHTQLSDPYWINCFFSYLVEDAAK